MPNLKLGIFFAVVLTAALTGAQQQDKSVHHAAMHAEHWINHHTSAPHGKAYQHRVAKRNHNARHAVKHAEHWIDHHVSAPHKTPPPK